MITAVKILVTSVVLMVFFALIVIVDNEPKSGLTMASGCGCLTAIVAAFASIIAIVWLS